MLLVFAYFNPELSYDADVDQCQIIKPEILYQKYGCAKCKASKCIECRSDLSVKQCVNPALADLNKVKVESFSPCQPCTGSGKGGSSSENGGSNANTNDNDKDKDKDKKGIADEEPDPAPAPVTCSKG